MGNFEVTWIDITVVVLYLIGALAVGLYVSRKTQDSEGYFLAGRRLLWPLVGLSLYASNMSGSSFVGLAGSGYHSGIAVYNYEWVATVILIFFVFFVLPFYIRSRVFTMPEFLQKRFDRRSRVIFSGFTLFANLFIDAAAGLYAGGVVMSVMYPEVPIWIPIAMMGVLAGLYTIFGGLSAVVITDSIQAVVLILGAILISVIAFSQIDSWEQVVQAAPENGMRLILPADDAFLPWPGLFTGVFIIGFYFWATNQFIVQRTLGAKDLNHGRWGALFAGLLKLPVLFLMVLPGTIALVLYPDLPSPDLVFPTLTFDLLPVGLRGFILAAMIAAIMSSIDSTLNSASTLVTMDFVKHHRPQVSQKTLVRIGRIVTGVFMIFAVLWAPQITQFPTLWQYLQSILAYITPPVVVCFLAGLFWVRANKDGAFLTLAIGVPLGVIGFFANEIFGLMQIHFLYACFALFIFNAVVMAVVSLSTPRPAADVIKNYTWSLQTYREETEDLRGLPWWQNYRYQALVLLSLTIAIVAWFW
ncbi:MAG: sodium:solute symporter [Opitutales bacterium]|nr:sodium:solute symporter [Opitutales bacterium]